MRRILITGGSGFIGTNLVEHLRSSDATEILNFDLRTPPCPEHLPYWSCGDMLSGSFSAAVHGFQPTHLVHLAARTDLEGRSMREYSINVDGVRAVLACSSSSAALERMIFASSRIVCELGAEPVCDYDYCPPNFYGRSKVIGEQLVRAHPHTASWVVVRPTSIWGPWGGAPYRDFFLSLARGTYVHPGHERIEKHYGYVGNVAFQIDRLLMAPERRAHGRTFYLADFRPTEVLDFATQIRRQLGMSPPRSAPIPVLKLLARSMDALQVAGMKNPPLTTSRLNNLRTAMLFDLGAVAEIVGRLPYTLEQGIRATIAHLESQGEIRRQLPAVS